MPYATITGQLKDSDGTPWKRATWTAVPVSPSSKPVFPDGSPVPTTSGLLDDTGHFSGQIPQTIDIRPPGTTLTVTITSMTSAPPLTLTKVQIVSTAVDLGALLSPRIPAPRIKSSAIVYAYNSPEVTNPVHGNGYVNTTEEVSYIYMQNSWVKIGASPVFDVLTADRVMAGNLFATDPPILTLGESCLRISNPTDGIYFDGFGATPTAETSMRFRVASSDGSLFTPVLYLDKDTFQCFRPAVFNGLSTQQNDLAGIQTTNGGVWLGWNVNPGSAHGAFIVANGGAGGGFDWYNVPPNTKVDATTVPHMTLHGSGQLNVKQGVVCPSFTVNNANSAATMVMSSFGQPNRYFIDSWGPDAATVGDMILRVAALNGQNGLESLWIQGNGSAQFNHNLNVVGTLTAGVKTFNIPHPLGGERRLIHACLEGPENGVYYRGEAELVDGRAIVELPAYFEALTQADGRTVQLTQVDDGGELGLFAASPVVDGKFSIRSNVSAAIVSWEVKAERRDLPRLDVEPATKGERSESES